MKVFTAEHDGHYLGGISVIVAKDLAQAKEMLKAELVSRHLETNGIELKEIKTKEPSVTVLFDGDY